MRRRVLAIFLVLGLAVCAAACGQKTPDISVIYGEGSGVEVMQSDLPPDQSQEPEQSELPIENLVPEQSAQPELPPAGDKPLLYDDVKGIWLSQFDLAEVYCSGGKQKEQAEFTSLMAQILDRVKEQGFNTVFLQIRPYADSMYPSAYYPMSAYAVGSVGGKAVYDPVAIIVELAHARELSIHGWINPLRGMTDRELQAVPGSYPMGRWYGSTQKGTYIVQVKDRWYLNPAYPEVRELIVKGAAEALHNYPFDGLHMDDYFYPVTDPSFDADAYAAYQKGGGTQSLADWRRGNISALVAGLYEAAHAAGCIYGISPAGNVDTVYNTMYADVYLWCSTKGYLDYICPQVYFGLEHGSHDFVKVSRTYAEMIKQEGISLIIGMTLEKAKTKEDKWAGSGKDEWRTHEDVLARCLQKTTQIEGCTGISMFSYQYFFDPVTGGSVPETQAERDHLIPMLQEISWN